MRWGFLLVVALLSLAIACRGGGEEVQPTPTPAADRSSATAQPTPTPETVVETLAFLRDGDVWLVNADGSGERRLTDLGDVQWFSWISPNLLDIAAGADTLRHLLIDLSGTATEPPFPAASAFDAGFTTVRARGAWSADGTRYVVPVEQQLVVFERSGAEVARLQAGPPIVENPDKTRGECGLSLGGEPDRLIFGPTAFSPDGQRVLVAVNCLSASGAYQLYSSVYEVSLDGAINRPLLGELSTNFRLSDEFLAPRFSPDGAHVAQMAMGGLSLCPVERGLAVANADGSDARALAPAALTELQGDLFGGIIDFDWSPAGDAIVASFDVSICQVAGPLEPGFTGLYVLKLDESGEEKLLDGAVSSVAWSPSGHFIAFVAGKYFGQTSEPPVIRLLDLTTRQVVDLAAGAQPAWQPQP